MSSESGVEDQIGLGQNGAGAGQLVDTDGDRLQVALMHAGRETPHGALRFQSTPHTVQMPGPARHPCKGSERGNNG